MQALTAGELVCAVRGADGAGQTIASGLGDKLFGFDGISQHRIFLVNRNIFLDPAEHSKFRFYRDSFGVSGLDNAFGNSDVFVKWVVRGVNHDTGIKAAVNALQTGLFVAMVEMDREDCFGEDFIAGPDNRFEHPLVGIGASAF